MLRPLLLAAGGGCLVAALGLPLGLLAALGLVLVGASCRSGARR